MYVIDTATKTVVVPSIPVGFGATHVNITPDGRWVYVANMVMNDVSVIDTSTNTVVASIPVMGNEPVGVTFTPDGKRGYVTYSYDQGIMSVIDTTTNTATVVPISGGTGYYGVVITPDGKRGYINNYPSNLITVIDTLNNTVVTSIPIPVEFSINGMAITPDGKQVYVTTNAPYYLKSYLFVIDISTNKVVSQSLMEGHLSGIFFSPLPTRTTFAAFNVNKLNLGQRHKDLFLLSSFTLGKDSNGIDLKGDAVTLKVGSLTLTIPAGSFRKNSHGLFTFVGEIDKLWVEAVIKPLGNNRYVFQATEYGAPWQNKEPGSRGTHHRQRQRYGFG